MSPTGTVTSLDASAQLEALASFAHNVRDVPSADVPTWAAYQAEPILAAAVTIQPVSVLIPAPQPAHDDEAATIALTIPLMVDGHLWGDLRAVRAEEDFSSRDQAAADLIASLVVGVLEKHALERTSQRDPLTGLANGRALDEQASRLLARVGLGSPRRVTAVSVGTTDRDKAAEVATLLMRSFSPLAGSLIARVGFSDFTVLVADHPVADVAAAADAFSASAEASPTAPEVFCGLASTSGSQPWETAAHLLAAARKACDRARRERGLTPPTPGSGTAKTFEGAL